MTRYASLCSLVFAWSFLLASTSMRAQQLTWARGLAGYGVQTPDDLIPGENDCAVIVVDDDGNLYTAGTCIDTLDLDPGPGQLLTTGSFQDLFLAKYSDDGELLWGGRLSALQPQWSAIASIDVDPNGNVVLLGWSTGQMDMDLGPGISPLDMSSLGSTFIAKYDPTGELLWARYFEGAGTAISADMDVAEDGSIVLLDNFYLSVDPDPSIAVDQLTGSQHSQFLAKYDADGNYLWGHAFSGTGIYGHAECVRVDPDGMIHVAGFFQNTVDFDPGSGETLLTAQPATSIPYIAKFDPAGGLIWARAFDVEENVFAWNIELEVDIDRSIVFIGDYFGYSADLDPGPGVLPLPVSVQTSMFMGRLDPAGELLMGKAITGGIFPCELDLDEEGNIYIAGSLGYADVDPSPMVVTLQSQAPSAFADFLLRYTPQGDLCWARTFGNNGYGGSTLYPALDVAHGHQYMASAFKQTADMDPGPDQFNLVTTSFGTNGYIARFDGNILPDLGPDRTICEGTLLELDPHADGFAYTWQDGSTAPVHTVSEAGTYWITGMNEYCPFSDTVHIDVEDCSFALEMPNVFSPDGDGVNEAFVPIVMNRVDVAQLQVFNRWGHELFSTTDLRSGWNGRVTGDPVPEGVYYWTLRYRWVDGQEYLTLHGTVSLLR